MLKQAKQKPVLAQRRKKNQGHNLGALSRVKTFSKPIGFICFKVLTGKIFGFPTALDCAFDFYLSLQRNQSHQGGL
jgi:hypothetical protein